MNDVTKKDYNKVSFQQQLFEVVFKNISKVLDNISTFKKLSIEE
jgi:hypothetical protein